MKCRGYRKVVRNYLAVRGGPDLHEVFGYALED